LVRRALGSESRADGFTVDEIRDRAGDVNGKRHAKDGAHGADRRPRQHHRPRTPQEEHERPHAHDAEREHRMAFADSVQVGRKLGDEGNRLLDHRPALADRAHHEHDARHRDQPAAGNERDVAGQAVGAPLLLQEHEDAERRHGDERHDQGMFAEGPLDEDGPGTDEIDDGVHSALLGSPNLSKRSGRGKQLCQGERCRVTCITRRRCCYALRTIAGVRALMDGAPTCCMFARSSVRSSSSTRSTPGWPNAPSPQIYGRPTHTPCAPMASALTMSVPRRKPLSTRIGMRPRTASTISGSASMVERPLSSLRAPWLETMMPSMPFSAASTASSCARMPLSTIFIFVVSRRRFRKSQVIAEDWVFVRPETSTPSYMERRFRLACRLLRSWQVLQSRVSVRCSLNSVSWLRPPLRSTVTATTGQPAFSARVTNALATSHLLVA